MTVLKSIAFVLVITAVLSCTSCPEPIPGPGPGAAGDMIAVASFNLQVFGPTKAGNPAIMDIFGQIIRHYDIVAVQEIRDAGGTAIVALKAAVNSTGAAYDYVVGPREGRTTSQEQYAFFYNTATIEPLGTPYVFAEGAVDTFEREPYVAQFRVKGKAFDFALVNIHTKPTDATAEIARLPEVMADSASRTGEADILLLGDFNADGSYYDESGYSSTFPSSTYNWLIDNGVDTTVATSSNTYDRVVTLNSSDEDFTGNAGAYRFDLDLQLGTLVPTDVSDHYPIWVEFWTGKDTQ